MFNINCLKINLTRIISGLVIALGLILLVLAISARVASQNKPGNVINIPPSSVIPSSNISAEENKNNGILYVIDAGNGKKIYDGVFLVEKSPLSNLNVFTVLKALSEVDKAFDLKYNYNFPQFGIFIESIAGVKNGDDGKYWQYYVNDKLGEVAADKKEVKAGDKVEWRFGKAPGI